MKRTDERRKAMNPLTPIKAIRAKCLDCCCGSANEVRECTLEKCGLHAYRMGRNPNIKPREYTQEQKEAMAVRLQDAREAKKPL